MMVKEKRAERDDELWALIEELRSVSDRLTAAAEKRRRAHEEGSQDDRTE